MSFLIGSIIWLPAKRRSYLPFELPINNLPPMRAMDLGLIYNGDLIANPVFGALVRRRQSIAQFLAGLEKWYPLTRYVHRIAGTGIATRAGVALARRERAKTPQFHSATCYQTQSHFFKECIDDLFDFAHSQSWVRLGYRWKKF
jgi:hypothetical protein